MIAITTKSSTSVKAFRTRTDALRSGSSAVIMVRLQGEEIARERYAPHISMM
jgi:hypothetical protein